MLLYFSQGAVSIGIFKMYLSRVLGEFNHQGNKQIGFQPLRLYECQSRLQVGSVLMRKPLLGKPGPYIPTFYQECSAIYPNEASLGRRMQQPLAHLYFLTVLEHVLSKEKSLASMVKVAGLIFNLANREDSKPDLLAVLHIELQAVLQVLTKLLAELLGDESEDHVKFVELRNSIDAINHLLGFADTGGGKVGGHGMVVALHLLKVLKSSRKFIELMTTNSEVLRKVECLWGIHEQLQVRCNG